MDSNKNILIFGMGISGTDAHYLCKELGCETFLFDDHPASFEQDIYSSSLVQKDEIQQMNLDFAIVSPGISPNHSLYKILLELSIPLLSEVEFAQRVLESKKQFSGLLEYIGITGTNGKTSTCMLLDFLLKQVPGTKSLCLGNIGESLSRYTLDLLSGEKKLLKKTYLILELSSFQLECVHDFFVHHALFLSLSVSHQERYLSYEEYLLAKMNLVKNFKKLKSIHIYPQRDLEKNLLKEKLKDLQYLIWDIDENKKIKINHNVYRRLPYYNNFLCCDSILNSLGIDVDYTCLEYFQLPAYRQQIFSFGKENCLINDSKSTNWQSTYHCLLFAKEIFNQRSFIFAIGGKLRDESVLMNDDYLNLLFHEIQKTPHLKLVLFGEIYNKKEFDCLKIEFKAKTLNDLFNWIKERKLLQDNSLVVSPGLPSFDEFKNYIERGDFIEKRTQDCIRLRP